MKFEVHYRRVADNRAPEYVDLRTEYTFAGVVEATTKREVERMLAAQPAAAVMAGETRALRLGDVLIENKQAWILTHGNAWAMVKVIKGGSR